jgi:hypothetical protein
MKILRGKQAIRYPQFKTDATSWAFSRRIPKDAAGLHRKKKFWERCQTGSLPLGWDAAPNPFFTVV